MEQVIYIFAAKPYDFEDKKDSKRVQGVSFWYLIPNTKPGAPGAFGHEPLKASLSIEQAKSLNGPGLYSATSEMRPYNGQAQSKIVGVAFMEAVEVGA